jgi:HK97 gp10 family phage protein
MAGATQSVASEQLTGFRELRTALRRLPAEMEDKVLTDAVEAGGKIVERSAKANVTRETGALANAIRLVVTKGRRGSKSAKSRVGVDKKYRKGGRRPVRYAHLVEFGHYAAGGKFVPPKPFLRRAINTNKGRLVSAMTAVLKQGLRSAARKVAKQ